MRPGTAGCVSSTTATRLAGVGVEERPTIADLAACFGVERGLIENDLAFGAGGEFDGEVVDP